MVLPTPYGDLKISDALLCPSIEGTIISTGKFGKMDGRVEYDPERVTSAQNSLRTITIHNLLVLILRSLL